MEPVAVVARAALVARRQRAQIKDAIALQVAFAPVRRENALVANAVPVVLASAKVANATALKLDQPAAIASRAEHALVPLELVPAVAVPKVENVHARASATVASLMARDGLVIVVQLH